MSYRGHITSKQNPHIADVRTLAQDTRHSSGTFLVEGLRLVQSAVDMHYPLTEIYVSESFAVKNSSAVESWSEAGYALWQVSDLVLKSITETQTPQGVAAVARLLPQKLDVKAANSLLLVDNVRDPGNLGTILRTAQATGMDGVLLSPGCVDAFSPKVVRAAMGAHYTLPIETRVTWEDLVVRVQDKICVLADADGSQLYWELNWVQPMVLIISNEAFGASPEARQLANQTVRIPMAREAESLNAAVAASVLMYEIYRQHILYSAGKSICQ
ncbi:MAG: TrmH family RNA methyltransferase [Anaerolineae bacterium]